MKILLADHRVKKMELDDHHLNEDKKS